MLYTYVLKKTWLSLVVKFILRNLNHFYKEQVANFRGHFLIEQIYASKLAEFRLVTRATPQVLRSSEVNALFWIPQLSVFFKVISTA